MEQDHGAIPRAKLAGHPLALLGVLRVPPCRGGIFLLQERYVFIGRVFCLLFAYRLLWLLLLPLVVLEVLPTRCTTSETMVTTRCCRPHFACVHE